MVRLAKYHNEGLEALTAAWRADLAAIGVNPTGVALRLTEAGARVRNAQPLLDPERVAGMLMALGPAQRADALRGLRLLVDAADTFVRAGREALTAQVAGDVL